MLQRLKQLRWLLWALIPIGFFVISLLLNVITVDTLFKIGYVVLFLACVLVPTMFIIAHLTKDEPKEKQVLHSEEQGPDQPYQPYQQGYQATSEPDQGINNRELQTKAHEDYAQPHAHYPEQVPPMQQST